MNGQMQKVNNWDNLNPEEVLCEIVNIFQKDQ
jgi:hypothetical protein